MIRGRPRLSKLGGIWMLPPGLARLARLPLALPVGLRAPRGPPPANARPPGGDGTPLAPPPPPSSATPVPALGAPPDLRPFLGLALVGVDVVMDDERWPDEHPPTITTMRGGDIVSTGL